MTYWAASKLPASVTDSIHFYSTGTSNLPQLFRSMLKGIVFSFRFGFFFNGRHCQSHNGVDAGTWAHAY